MVKSTTRAVSPRRTASAAASTAGLRSAVARSRGSSTAPTKAVAGALARTTRRLSSSRISGSGTAAMTASAAATRPSAVRTRSRQSRPSLTIASQSSRAIGASLRAICRETASVPSSAPSMSTESWRTPRSLAKRPMTSTLTTRMTAPAITADSVARKPHPTNTARTIRPGALTANTAAVMRGMLEARRPITSHPPRPSGDGPRCSADRVVRRERSQVDEIRHGGADIDDLNRSREAHQQRPDHRSAAEVRQQLCRDVGAVEAWHDQNVGGPAEPAERVELAHQPSIERDIRAHLAIVLEIRPAAVEQPDRLAHTLAIGPRRVAEIRVGEQRDARHETDLGVTSITRVTSSSTSNELRVTPLTIASASPQATMQAANTLRSRFT